MGAGKVFIGTPDDYMVAIDQKTGEESWRSPWRISGSADAAITGAPLFVKDKVIVGVTGGDSGLPRLYHGVRREDRALEVALLYDARAWRKKVTTHGRAIAGSSAAGRRG